MFGSASAFDQDLGWCVDNDVDLDDAFGGTPCASTSCGVVQMDNCPTPKPTPRPTPSPISESSSSTSTSSSSGSSSQKSNEDDIADDDKMMTLVVLGAMLGLSLAIAAGLFA